jgi:hypothetical protein
MKKSLFIAALFVSCLSIAQTKTIVKAKKTTKKEVKAKTETVKKAEEVKVVEAPKEGLLNKVNKTAKTVEEKANLPIVNENNTVKKVKDGAIKVKDITGN